MLRLSFNECRFDNLTLQRGCCAIWRATTPRCGGYIGDCLLDDCSLIQCEVNGAEVERSSPGTAVQSSILTNLMFQQDIIQDANWYACQLTQCLWQASTLERHIMGSCRLEKCSWQTIEGRRASGSPAACRAATAQLRLQGASFHRSELEGCSFADSDLTSAIFAEVQALRCDFERATLTTRRRRRPGSANAR